MPSDSLDILNCDLKVHVQPPEKEEKQEIQNSQVTEKTTNDSAVNQEEIKQDSGMVDIELSDGSILSANIIDGKLSGICKILKDNHCIAELSYLNGIKDGIFKFFQNDKTTAVFEYKNGKKNGVATYYNAEGGIQKTEEYKDDLKHGVSYTYYNDASIFEKCEYENGILKAPAVHFNRNGKKIEIA